MSNVLKAFKNIIDNPLATVNPAKISSNRVQNQGDALETYTKDAFSELLGRKMSDYQKDRAYSKTFSWLGNKNNIPDSIIKNGDAIEVKKLETIGSAQVQLNSSHPKDKIYADDPKITPKAKLAEIWKVKDIIYVVGGVASGDLKQLWLIYGDCYAANRESYLRITDTITKGILSIPDIEFNPETNEIARVNKVDPLGITDLRVRGMWLIANPAKLYSDLVNTSPGRQYYLLMREEKYQSFPQEDKEKLEKISIKGFKNSKIKIRNPNNPAQMLNARFIKYEF